jgi:neurotransmitter:Na+ symporter, NSS family
MTEEFAHEKWSSRRAFLLAAIGSAIGLGNVWRFPYITGVNGGGAFVLIYCVCILVIALPLLMAEIAIGRRGAESPIRTVQILSEQEGGSKFWHALGWQAVIAPTIGLMYYSIIAGWTLDYAVANISGGFAGVNAEAANEKFTSLVGDPLRLMFWHALFIALTVAIVARGIRKGLEKAISYLMPCLFVILLLLLGYTAFTADFSGAAKFMFKPDFSKVTADVVLMAIGQAFFSVNVAVGALITYGAYMPKHISIPRVAGIIALADTGVALMMGLIIFPLVISYGLVPGEGPGLVFVTLPIAFGQMPAGIVFGTLFFVLMSVAALTSTLGMLEPSVSYLEEKRRFTRPQIAIAIGIIVWLCGLPSLLSFNILSDFKPLDQFTLFEGKTIFDLMDFFVANILIPVGGLLLALFAGWVMTKDSIADELDWNSNDLQFKIWRFLVKIVAPIAIISIFIVNIFFVNVGG